MFSWNYCLFNNFKWRIFRIETRQKKLKFKALAIRQPDQTTEMIDKINDAIDNPENENSNWEVLSSGKTSICHIWFSLQSFIFSFKHLIPSLSLWIIIHLPKIKQKSSKILWISETRLKLNRTSLTSIPLRGYNIEYSTTGSSNGSTLIYIKNVII